jgi:predicted alpha/beta hydrolase
MDIKASMAYLNEKFPGLTIYYLSHRVGGQLADLVPKINPIKGMVTMATSSEYFGNMSLNGRLRSFYFFEIIRPLVHVIYG